MKLWNLFWKTSILIKHDNYLPFGLLLIVWCRPYVACRNLCFGIFFYMSISSEVGRVQRGEGGLKGWGGSEPTSSLLTFRIIDSFNQTPIKGHFGKGSPLFRRKELSPSPLLWQGGGWGERGGGDQSQRKWRKKKKKSKIKITIKSGSEFGRGKSEHLRMLTTGEAFK